jgi:hypothetical protein
MALNFYITQVQRLLHDANGQMWPTSELTDYINEARNRICDDTYCLRQVVTGESTVAGQEQYLVSSIPVTAGYTPVNVMQIDLYYGTLRITLDYNPWRRHCILYRAWQTFQSRPIGFTRMGANYFYLGPTPDQVYPIDITCSLRPPPLTSDATPEPIPAPFTDLIKWYAAHLAKFKEQSYAEAENFEKIYFQKRRLVGVSFMNAVIPSVYAG